MILRPPGLVALSSVSIAAFAEPFDFDLSSSFTFLHYFFRTCHDRLLAPIAVNRITGETKALRQADATHTRSNLAESHPNDRRHPPNCASKLVKSAK